MQTIKYLQQYRGVAYARAAKMKQIAKEVFSHNL
jgi:hypothetical protein